MASMVDVASVVDLASVVVVASVFWLFTWRTFSPWRVFTWLSVVCLGLRTRCGGSGGCCRIGSRRGGRGAASWSTCRRWRGRSTCTRRRTWRWWSACGRLGRPYSSSPHCLRVVHLCTTTVAAAAAATLLVAAVQGCLPVGSLCRSTTSRAVSSPRPLPVVSSRKPLAVSYLTQHPICSS